MGKVNSTSLTAIRSVYLSCYEAFVIVKLYHSKHVDIRKYSIWHLYSTWRPCLLYCRFCMLDSYFFFFNFSFFSIFFSLPDIVHSFLDKYFCSINGWWCGLLLNLLLVFYGIVPVSRCSISVGIHTATVTVRLSVIVTLLSASKLYYMIWHYWILNKTSKMKYTFL